MKNLQIVKVTGREIMDSRGNPTVEAQVTLLDGTVALGTAPSGASTGVYEALELRDKDPERYNGKGVLKAVESVNTVINDTLKGMDASDIYAIDRAMIKADGTKDKSGVGANAILAVSIASARAAATAMDMPLYKFLGGIAANRLPVPMMNILNGGAHVSNGNDFQEFMIVPVGACCFREALRMGTEVYHTLKNLLDEQGYATAVGDEGGFAPAITDVFRMYDLLLEAVKEAGYEPGKDICFAMDAAASELYNADSGLYDFPRESKAVCRDKDVKAEEQPDTISTTVTRSTEQMIELYEELVDRYPLISIEDPLNENDWEGWKLITEKLGHKVQLVGDDLFVTNTERLSKGIEEDCGNSILIKLNQIGSVSETLEAIKMAHNAGYTAITSHRSGETEDTTIADLAAALNCGQIKTGAPCRSERVAKYNRLLRIEEELGDTAVYPGIKAFNVGK